MFARARAFISDRKRDVFFASMACLALGQVAYSEVQKKRMKAEAEEAARKRKELLKGQKGKSKRAHEKGADRH